MNWKAWFMMALALFALPDAVPAQEASLQDIAKAMQALPQIVIYQAKEIVTLDPAKPTVQAVAVLGDRIIATGALDELKAAAGKQPYRVDTTSRTRWSSPASSPSTTTRSSPGSR